MASQQLLALAAALCVAQAFACDPNPCQHDGVCRGSSDSYTCLCPAFWKGANCEEDVDECEDNNGGCGDPSYYYCTNLEGAAPACLTIGGGQINSDPHFNGFMSQTFDVEGKSGGIYSLISDENLAVNARFAQAYTTGATTDEQTLMTSKFRAQGTWIAELGVLLDGVSDSVQVMEFSVEPSTAGMACPTATGDFSSDSICFMSGNARVVVNGKEINGLTPIPLGPEAELKLHNFKSFGRASLTAPAVDLSVDFVPPPKSWEIAADEAPQYTHLNINFARIELSNTANGIMGVTSRVKYADGKPVLTSTGPNGQGIIDGTIEDYELSSVTDTAFKFSQFAGQRCDSVSCSSEDRTTFKNVGAANI